MTPQADIWHKRFPSVLPVLTKEQMDKLHALLVRPQVQVFTFSGELACNTKNQSEL